MAKTIRILTGMIIASLFPLLLNSCGGGGAAGGPVSQYIQLTNGKVVVEQGEGMVVIKAGESQLPGVGFDQDAVEVKLYAGDGFANPRTDTPPPSSLISTFRVRRDGTLLDDLSLPVGIYTAVAENIRVVQDGKEFRSALTAYVFEVFESGGTLHTTLPLKFEARFPALGAVIEDSYVAFLTDAGAADGTSRLFGHSPQITCASPPSGEVQK
jgi:hypothetical protein